MPQFSDLASLFQLGAGVSLALSVFTEPVIIAEDRVRRRLKRDILLLPKRDDEKTETKRQKIFEQQGTLRIALLDAEKLSKKPRSIIWLGVFFNLGILIGSSIFPAEGFSVQFAVLLCLLSVSPYVLAFCWLQTIANAKIHSIIGADTK